MHRNKVLLLTSTATPSTVQDSISISYGLYLLRNTLINNGIECDIHDLELVSEKECLSAVKNNKYDVIGMSVTHCNMQSDLTFIGNIKKTIDSVGGKCLFIAGGMSATLNYEAWLQSGMFDVLFIGYAEESLLKVCERYGRNDDTDEFTRFLHEVAGIAFRDTSREIIFKPSRPLSAKDFVHKMYTLALEMDVPYYEYWDFMRRKKTEALSLNSRSYVIENARLYTSSKCLANCGYCCCPAFIPAAQKTSSAPIMLTAEQVFDLVLHHVQKFKARSFSFNDEDFLVGNKAGINRVLQLCDLIVAAKMDGKIPEGIRFSCQTRASNFLVNDTDKTPEVNVRLIKKMAEAKFHNVSLGIETFSERLLRVPSVNKPKVSTRDYQKVLDAMMEHALFPTINIIIGIPEETPDELISTIEHTMSYVDKPCQISVTTRMNSFPGAPIYNSKDYPAYYNTWENPDTHEVIHIPDYFIPRDPVIASLVESLENEKYRELDHWKIKYQLDRSQVIPRIAIALCSFAVVTKHLGRHELNIKISHKLDELFSSIKRAQ